MPDARVGVPDALLEIVDDRAPGGDGVAALADGRRDGAHLAGQGTEQAPDLARGFGGLGGQGLHLGGHHREAAPGLPGPGRLDRGVQGEQVGLGGDGGDGGRHHLDLRDGAFQHRDPVDDLSGSRVDLLHRRPA